MKCYNISQIDDDFDICNKLITQLINSIIIHAWYGNVFPSKKPLITISMLTG